MCQRSTSPPNAAEHRAYASGRSKCVLWAKWAAFRAELGLGMADVVGFPPAALPFLLLLSVVVLLMVVVGAMTVARQSRRRASGGARSFAKNGTNGRHTSPAPCPPLSLPLPLPLPLLYAPLRAVAAGAGGVGGYAVVRARAMARTAARWQWDAKYAMSPGNPAPAATRAAGSIYNIYGGNIIEYDRV